MTFRQACGTVRAVCVRVCESVGPHEWHTTVFGPFSAQVGVATCGSFIDFTPSSNFSLSGPRRVRKLARASTCLGSLKGCFECVETVDEGAGERVGCMANCFFFCLLVFSCCCLVAGTSECCCAAVFERRREDGTRKREKEREKEREREDSRRGGWRDEERIAKVANGIVRKKSYRGSKGSQQPFWLISCLVF